MFFANSVVHRLRPRLRPLVLSWSVFPNSVRLDRVSERSLHTYSQAPEPLLPNFGVGSITMYQRDLTMLILHNAKERTLQNSLELS
jgi:hypothetical protein